MASELDTLVYDSKINHDKKLVHIFTPKCGSSSVTQWLHYLDPTSTWTSFPQIATSIPPGYTSFATIRAPIPWVLSGYKMFKTRWNLPYDFETHCKMILNPMPLIRHEYKNHIQDPEKGVPWGSYWWHCGITPDTHLLPSTKTFKIEDTKSLQKWMCKYYPNALDVPFVHTNGSKPLSVKITQTAHELIKKKMHFYAARFNYEGLAYWKN